MNCEQINILLTYFINNKLSDKIMAEIEYHLNICLSCREKYMNLIRIKQNYKEIQEKICPNTENLSEPMFNEKEYSKFMNNLSAYVDNELNDRENIRIKKFAILNPNARQELENIIYFRQLLQDSFTKTKSQLKKDIAGHTINILNENSNKTQQKNNKFSAGGIFIITYLFCIICAIILLKIY